MSFTDDEIVTCLSEQNENVRDLKISRFTRT